MTADDLLRPAHDAAYRFPPGFPGFVATLRTQAGETGTLTVRDRKDVDAAIDAGWVRDELASMVAHRWASSYAEGDGRWRKEVAGDVVTFTDDPFESSYRLHEGQIAQVHRTAGDARFAIVVHDREAATDGRRLPVRFTVFHWALEPDGRLIRADHYRDTYTLISGVHLPARREVTSASDAGLVTRSVELTNHAVAA